MNITESGRLTLECNPTVRANNHLVLHPADECMSGSEDAALMNDAAADTSPGFLECLQDLYPRFTLDSWFWLAINYSPIQSYSVTPACFPK